MINVNNILTYSLLVYFILRTHGINGYLPSVWVIPLLLIISIAFKKIKSTYFLFLINELKWVIISFILLLAFIYYDYGNWKLQDLFNNLAFSIPFFIVGFDWGIFNKKKYFNQIIKYLYFFTAFYLLSKLIQINGPFIIDESFLGNAFYSVDNNLQNLIFFWPFTTIVGIIGFTNIWYDNEYSKYYKNFTLFCFSIIITSILLSGFGAPVFLLMLTFIIFILLGAPLFSRFTYFLYLIFAILFTFIATYLMAFYFDLGDTSFKLQGLFKLFTAASLDDTLNQITSNRYGLISYSFDQFLQNPLFGHGAYYEDIEHFEFSIYRYVSGTHSFVFDTLAFFGLLAIPFLLIIYRFNLVLIRFYRKNEIINKNVSRIWLSLFLSFTISNLLNPYFLFSYLDNFIFLFIGYITGSLYYIKFYINHNRSAVNLE